MRIYIYIIITYISGGRWCLFFKMCATFFSFFFSEGGSFTRFAPRGTIETKNLLYRFAKYLTAPSGAGWFCLFIFYSYIYICISKAQYCALREIAEVVDSFLPLFFLRITEKPRESQSEIVSRQHCLVCVCAYI